MKIRTGFVSNSSSSSFVVLFPSEPQNVDDVKKMLFGDQEEYYGMYDEGGWSTNAVAKTIWNDICDQQKNDFEKAKDILSNDYNGPDYDDFSHIEDNNERWEAYGVALEAYGKKLLKEFFNIRKLKLKKLNNESIEDGTVLYCFEYGDGDSYGSALEHGDLFEKLKYIKISNH